MKELLDQFIQQGFTREQAENAMYTITEWLKKEYPVAGTLMASWMKNGEKASS